MLAFVDIETTGLDPDEDVLLELAIVVTNSHLQEYASFTIVIQPASLLPFEKMDQFVVDMHTKNGLLEELPGGVCLESAQAEALQFLQGVISPQISPMCGSSVHFDRAFLKKHMPKLEAYFHYRCIDVSTVKELTDRWVPEAKAPRNDDKRHRALDDVLESIAELRHYKTNVFKIEEPE